VVRGSVCDDAKAADQVVRLFSACSSHWKMASVLDQFPCIIRRNSKGRLNHRHLGESLCARIVAGFSRIPCRLGVSSHLGSIFLKLSLAIDHIQVQGTRVCGAIDLLRSQQKELIMRKLYVGNLPYEIGEAELQELFARVGPVDSVKVMRDQMTGRPRGFAFVEMSTDEGAQTAIRDLNESQVGGRSLSVNEARPKPASSGGFGGGSGRRREPRW
jgi:hypothetical protein